MSDKTVSIPMFNLLCIQQRIKIAGRAAMYSGEIGEVRDQISAIHSLVDEAIVELVKLEKEGLGYIVDHHTDHSPGGIR